MQAHLDLSLCAYGRQSDWFFAEAVGRALWDWICSTRQGTLCRGTQTDAVLQAPSVDSLSIVCYLVSSSLAERRNSPQKMELAEREIHTGVTHVI